MPLCIVCRRISPSYKGLHRHLRSSHGFDAHTYYTLHPSALLERLDAWTEKVVVVESLGACWEWLGLLSPRGYGRMRMAGAPTDKAHRLALLTKGPLPAPEDYVMHECDNPPCVNPDHLEAGTPTQNARERRDRGRSCRGDAHHKAVLGDEGATMVRMEVLAGMTHAEVARRNGVSESAVCHVVARRSYAHVPDPDPDIIPF